MRALVMLALATGCVVDERTVLDTSAAAVQALPDTSDTCQPEWRIWLDSDGAKPGQTVLDSLRAEGTIDLNRIETVQLLGESEILAVDRRLPTEAVLTIDVPEDALAGLTDLVLTLDDGRRLVLEGAFAVGSAATGLVALTSGC